MSEIVVFCAGIALGIILSAGMLWLAHRMAAARYMSEKAHRGVEAKANYEDRLTAAMLEAAQLHKDGKPATDILKELLPKYPDVAMRLIRKLGGKGGISELFGGGVKE